MKQFFKYLLIRFSQIISVFILIQVISSHYPLTGYTFINLLGIAILFFAGFHEGSNLNLTPENKRKLLVFGFIITVSDILLFALIHKFVFNILTVILLTKTLRYLAEGIYYGHEVFSNYNKYHFFSLYPVNIAVEVRWVLKKYLGRLSQRYLGNSFFVQQTLINKSCLFRGFTDYNDKILNYSKTHEGILNILVAGCSDGQEAYSISAFCSKNNIPVSIIAFDLSQQAINNAQKGEFNLAEERAFILQSQKRQTLDHFDLHKDFFEIHGDIAVAKESIRRNIQFLVQDITKISYNSKFDFVFARRMLYYLPTGSVGSAIQKLKEALIHKNEPDNLIIDDYTKKLLKSYF